MEFFFSRHVNCNSSSGIATSYRLEDRGSTRGRRKILLENWGSTRGRRKILLENCGSTRGRRKILLENWGSTRGRRKILLENWGSTRGRKKIHPYRTWDSPSLLSNEYRGSFTGVYRSEPEVYHSSQTN
jgi:hypothetical protein